MTDTLQLHIYAGRARSTMSSALSVLIVSFPVLSNGIQTDLQGAASVRRVID